MKKDLITENNGGDRQDCNDGQAQGREFVLPEEARRLMTRLILSRRLKELREASDEADNPSDDGGGN